MININKDVYRDKVYACWLGKNIGGTMGSPYEGNSNLQDISGFTSESGVPLPNDDLDLQLIWLKAVRDFGPEKVDAHILGEYWMDYITPFPNEYGICKSNMRLGLVPGVSGAYNNQWKDSNGGWIRTEIWATLFPALPEKAIRYCYEDSRVDHGQGEGTYAAIFIAAMESAAFVVSDFRALLDIGLSKIPENCKVYKAVKLVIEAYENGKDWKEARQIIVDTIVKDMGWFQAPGNVAFVVIGMLYGEGDFKKSMIITINCGDDTDCTGATIGSIFGLAYGTACIPEDWKAHIGDEIVTMCVNTGAVSSTQCTPVPKTCTQLTDWIIETLPACIRRTSVSVTDAENDFSALKLDEFKGNDFSMKLASRYDYCFNIDFIYASALVEYDRAPDIAPNGEIGIRITFDNLSPSQKSLKLDWNLPEGFTVEGKRIVSIHRYATPYNDGARTTAEFKIKAGETIKDINRAFLHVTSDGRPTVGVIPFVFLG